MKRKRFVTTICFIMIVCCLLTSCSGGKTFGVFIGADKDQIFRMTGYGTVAIDAMYFDAAAIQEMHTNDKTVYSYLNIGTLEEFRDYYADYSHTTLSVYEDWPDEHWVDVNLPEWQDHIVDNVAASLAAKGIDGFFIDNLDVYDILRDNDTGDAYAAIVNMLGRLKQEYGLPIIVNGAGGFMREHIENGGESLVDGVNQECVFTTIDFSDKTYHDQQPEETEYYKEYVEYCAAHGYDVYLTEYAPSPQTKKAIADYCAQHGFEYFLAAGLELSKAA